MLKHSTSAAPSADSFTWMRAAKRQWLPGKIRPPVRPDRIICPVGYAAIRKTFFDVVRMRFLD
jgi:hypothetical protein